MSRAAFFLRGKDRLSGDTKTDMQSTITWRHDQLVHAGIDEELAEQLAEDRRYDLHALIELLERGCPPELAVRILAPLEDA